MVFRCLFSSFYWREPDEWVSGNEATTRRCPVSKRWEKNENQYSDGTQVLETRGGEGGGCQHRRIRRRRHVLFAGPVSAQSINVPPSFYFISVGFVFALGGNPTAPPPRTISTYAPLRLFSRPLLVSFRALARAFRSSSHFVLITSHRQGVYGLSASLGIHTTQLLIALPISARARSRSTPPAGLCSQRNTCPIINSHDPPIIGDLMVYGSCSVLIQNLLRPTFPLQIARAKTPLRLLAFQSRSSLPRFFLFFFPLNFSDLVINRRISRRALVSVGLFCGNLRSRSITSW